MPKLPDEELAALLEVADTPPAMPPPPFAVPAVPQEMVSAFATDQPVLPSLPFAELGTVSTPPAPGPLLPPQHVAVDEEVEADLEEELLTEVADAQMQATLDDAAKGNQTLASSKKPSVFATLVGDKLADIADNKPAPKRPKKNEPTAKGKNHATDDENGGEAEGRAAGQPKRSSRKVDDDRLYDGTQLHANHHGYFVHRDFAAHFFRWGWVARQCKPGMRILDVGSGQDLPLPRVLSAPNVYPNCTPSQVVCVDWNPIPRKFNPAWLAVHDEFDFNKRWPELVGSFLQDGGWVDVPNSHFDIVSCLEVIEHMRPEQAEELLHGMYHCLKPGGKLILSTPVFDGKAAANHIHEYGLRELWEKLVARGFTVVQRFGTFANLPDLKKVMPEEEQVLMEKLREFYSNDVISCFFAPKYPDQSRNNCWVCMRTVDYEAATQLQTPEG